MHLASSTGDCDVRKASSHVKESAVSRPYSALIATSSHFDCLARPCVCIMDVMLEAEKTARILVARKVSANASGYRD